MDVEQTKSTLDVDCVTLLSDDQMTIALAMPLAIVNPDTGTQAYP